MSGTYSDEPWRRAKPVPLATLQVAALMRRLGHEVQLFDDRFPILRPRR